MYLYNHTKTLTSYDSKIFKLLSATAINAKVNAQLDKKHCINTIKDSEEDFQCAKQAPDTIFPKYPLRLIKYKGGKLRLRQLVKENLEEYLASLWQTRSMRCKKDGKKF